MEEYKYLLERSRRFLETAELQLDRGFYDLAVFSLEQALQLYLKAYLLKLGLEFTKKWSIRRLLELIYKITNSDEIRNALMNYAVELGSLEDTYITSRYVAREYCEEEARKLLQTVRVVMDIVGRSIDR
ncbi:MAG: HEPN domain-containing protein [Candidatus Verstraetearchaeota archaeon]|nr:HEPN domain-containing protein [Candidatus Verstraetearchaeota archaeon]